MNLERFIQIWKMISMDALEQADNAPDDAYPEFKKNCINVSKYAAKIVDLMEKVQNISIKCTCNKGIPIRH